MTRPPQQELRDILAPAIELGLVEITVDAEGTSWYRVVEGVDEQDLRLALLDPEEILDA